MMAAGDTIGSYLIKRISSYGVEHVFGVPGDYTLGFYGELEKSELLVINTCDEQGAGFAADAYARIRGLGLVCITYCVGGLKVANATAQAFAEKSPVVVVSGAPGTKERIKNPLLHHKVRDFDTQLKVFQQFTVASTVLDNPEIACREIDRVLASAVRHKRPVYIELPRDKVSAPVLAEHVPAETVWTSEPAVLREALREAVDMINAAERPVLLAGVELHRFGLQDALLRLVEKTSIPVAATLLGKSVITEHHPCYLGVYEGAVGLETVTTYVESSDCVILLGTFMTDINLGSFTAHLDQSRSISVDSEQASIRYHSYDNVQLHDFIQGLIAGDVRRRQPGQIPHPATPLPFSSEPGKSITVRRLFQRLNAFLDEKTVVLADIGDALFAAADLAIHGRTKFLSPAYYATLGFAVPGSLGAKFADPESRPLVLVGDGAFQMTGMELATAVRFGLNPIVIVLNNGGYGTERPMLDGRFNDLHVWKYSRLPEILGAGMGFDVETEDDLDRALQAAMDMPDTLFVLDVHLDPGDMSPALQRLTRLFGQRVKQPEREAEGLG